MKGSKKKVKKDTRKRSTATEGTAPSTDEGEVSVESDAAEATAEDAGRASALEGRLLRLQADFDNYRKRTLREKDELWRRAHADLIEELLPVIDHMDLAMKAAVDHEAPDAFVEGFRLVQDQLLGTLARFGLSVQQTEECAFDPNLHEAIAHIPSASVEENHVATETRRGYMLGDQLLRPAQVVVSSGPGDDAADAESDPETTDTE